MKSCHLSVSYWPPENEYNPGIDAGQWGALLQNSAVCGEQQRNILLQMLSLGGEATCTQLAERFGKSANYYNSNMASLARAVHKQTGCPVAAHDDGERTYWPVLFVGRRAPGSQPGAYSWKLREELSEALESLRDSEEEKDSHMNEIGKNTILYGPPGTGKTYHTVNYAVAIIEGTPLEKIRAEPHGDVLARFQSYREAGQIAFVTFHQSYGYEDFIEGIRPVAPNAGEKVAGLSYKVQNGVFKEFCERAERAPDGDTGGDYGFSAHSTVWKVSLGGAGENPIKTDCMKNGYIRIGWDEYGEDLSGETEFKHGGKAILNAFYNVMQPGDIVLSCASVNSFDAIGVITGEAEWGPDFPHMKRFRNVKWLARGLDLKSARFALEKELAAATVYRLKTTPAHVAGVLRALLGTNTPAPPRVFIIDEINRGNISKIFGELITLIETEKRKGKPECVPVKLPCSQSEFAVPDNVWILGTMNTADRSIALLDTALRRRFRFREMMPDSSVLDGIEVDGVPVSGILDTLNRRLEALYDREHTLGHAWFLPLRETPTVERLGAVFRDSVIPLLQEYFYDDYEKIRLVLGDEKRKQTGGPQFFAAEEPDAAELFGTNPDFPLNAACRLNPETLTDIRAYRDL